MNYAVRYNDAAIRAAFLQYDVTDPAQKDLLATYTREIARLLISARFTVMSNNVSPALGLAYTSTYVYNKYREIGNRDPFVAEPFTVTFPAWHPRQGQKQQLTNLQKNVLYTFYQQEDTLVKRLTELFKVIGKASSNKTAIPENELKKASADFLGMSVVLNENGGPNTFFAVFDKLIQKAAAPDAKRESVMIVEITPPNAKTLPSGEKEKVVKFYPA